MNVEIDKIIIGNEQESCAVVRDMIDIEVRGKTLIIRLTDENIKFLFNSIDYSN